MKSVFVAGLVCSAISMVSAECPNGCNGHGKCTSYDMCICNRNWQANDCSERVCQYGLAHVDTPKGDLDMNGAITAPDVLVAENSFNYPYGTSEQFPQGRDSDLREVRNSAHYYMECSNKGSCNRETGECECFPGYDGAACQRASCPGFPDVCSGHGVCKSIRQLADADHRNVYELWDRHSTMGCECDDGFSGPDCSERKCKQGIDPLYYDDTATIRYATWDFAIVSNEATANFKDGMKDANDGYFALRFFDMFGEDWVTNPIKYRGTGSPNGQDMCDDIIEALEGLPNDVIPKGSVLCTPTHKVNKDPLDPDAADNWARTMGTRKADYKMAFWDLGSNFFKSSYDVSSAGMSGTVFRVKFTGNPGNLRQPEIELYLDGKRAALQTPTPGGANKLVTHVWTDGQRGESVDHFADHCHGVTVRVLNEPSGSLKIGGVLVNSLNYQYLSGMTATEEQLLKTCLGGSNFDNADNVEFFDWDYGSYDYPHLVKLVLSTASINDGGYYVALQYMATTSDPNPPRRFVLMNNFKSPDLVDTDNFEVYTTKGVLARVSGTHYVTFGFASNEIEVKSDNPSYPLRADLSCEINDNNAAKVQNWLRNFPDSQTTCLNKTSTFTMLSANFAKNPAHINLYNVEKISRSVDDKFYINSDISTNWASKETTLAEGFRVYKFFPNSDSTYTYVAPCSNRGLCNQESGLCECFHGYTKDDCSEQNSLAV